MLLLIIIFITTLVLTGGAYLFTNRTLENRDAAKVRARLAGKERPASKTVGGAQPLFMPDGEESKPIHQRILAKLNVETFLIVPPKVGDAK